MTITKVFYRIEPPRDLTERQLLFWHSFPSKMEAMGHARRAIALLHMEWHEDEQRYTRISNVLTHDLDDDPTLAEQLLNDKEKLIAYAAALRLRGA